MRGIASITRINGPEAARFRAERAKVIADATAKATPAAEIQAAHGERLAIRQFGESSSATRGEVVSRHQTFVPDISGIPFFVFWRDLNESRVKGGLPEATYGLARSAFNGGNEPEYVRTFRRGGFGLRALRTSNVDKMPSFHGQYEVGGNGCGIWHTVKNNDQQPIAYRTAKFALKAAQHYRNALLNAHRIAA